jgi:hypothetical protein
VVVEGVVSEVQLPEVYMVHQYKIIQQVDQELLAALVLMVFKSGVYPEFPPQVLLHSKVLYQKQCPIFQPLEVTVEQYQV